MYCCGYDPGALLFFTDITEGEPQEPLPDLILMLTAAAFAVTALGMLALTVVA